jgi:hypothetical protein
MVLQRLADEATPSAKRPPSEAIELQQIQAQLSLLSAVSSAQARGLVHLTQRRAEHGQMIYQATRRYA